MKLRDANNLLDSLARDAYVWAVVLLFSVFYSAKNLPAILCLITIIAILYEKSRPSKGCTLVLRLPLLGLVVTAATLFSPIDICMRKGDSFHLGVKPVIVCDGALGKARELYRNGKLPVKDFVIYEDRSFFNQVEWALTIVVPGRSESYDRIMKHLEWSPEIEEKREK